MIDTRFWHDGWVRKLNALDRYLFLYLLTNDKCSFCGIYELPTDLMAVETGIDKLELEQVMLPRLEPKVFYREGWVNLINFKKYHVNESPNNIKGFEEALKAIPSHILEMFKTLEGASRVLGTFAFASAFASTSLSEANASEESKKKL